MCENLAQQLQNNSIFIGWDWLWIPNRCEIFFVVERRTNFIWWYLLSVYNLSNHQDVDATKRMIEQYKKENKDQIRKNQSKLVMYFILYFICSANPGMIDLNLYPSKQTVSRTLSRSRTFLVESVSPGICESGNYFYKFYPLAHISLFLFINTWNSYTFIVVLLVPWYMKIVNKKAWSNFLHSCVFSITQSKDEEYLEALIEKEQHDATVRKIMSVEDEKREKAAKRKHKEALIDDLVSSFLWLIFLFSSVEY